MAAPRDHARDITFLVHEINPARILESWRDAYSTEIALLDRVAKRMDPWTVLV